MAARSNKIRERGEIAVKTVSYAVASLFIIISVIPLVWMISSSMKDNISIYRFPPQWIPEIPRQVEITLNYDESGLSSEEQFELDAMKAIWFTWKKMQNEAIGELVITGIKNGEKVYEASMPSYKFTVGRPEIVPTQLFTDAMMRLKLPIIRERGLTHFEAFPAGTPYEETRTDTTPAAASAKEAADVSSAALDEGQMELAEAVSAQIAGSGMIAGQVVASKEHKAWHRLFDNYYVLAQLAGGAQAGYGFQHYLLNSVIVTAGSIVSHLIIGGTAGFALAHLVRGRTGNALTLFFVATIMIPEIAILVPLYLTMEKLNLVNTLWGIILPHTAWGVVIFLFKGFFEQLPGELMQAARIDGASELRIYWRLVVPMSTPIFTVVSVMTFIAVWNEFLWPLVIARSPSVWTFTVALNDFQNRQSMGANVIMSSLVVATIPLMIIIISCQKLIERGVSFTGLKG